MQDVVVWKIQMLLRTNNQRFYCALTTFFFYSADRVVKNNHNRDAVVWGFGFVLFVCSFLFQSNMGTQINPLLFLVQRNPENMLQLPFFQNLCVLAQAPYIFASAMVGGAIWRVQLNVNRNWKSNCKFQVLPRMFSTRSSCTIVQPPPNLLISNFKVLMETSCKP